MSLDVVWILGCQRSGTTLVGSLLGAHPDVLLIDENEGAYRVASALLGASAIDETLAESLTLALAKYLDGRRPDVADVLAGRVRLLLKAPNCTFDHPQIAGLPGRHHVLFPLRDPRAVVASMLRLVEVPMIANQHRRLSQSAHAMKRHADDIASLADEALALHVRAARLWRIKTAEVAEIERGPLPCLRVPYESLVGAPCSWVARIQAAVALGPAAYRPHTEVLAGVGPGNHDRRRAVDAASVLGWMQVLDATLEHDVLHESRETALALGLVLGTHDDRGTSRLRRNGDARA